MQYWWVLYGSLTIITVFAARWAIHHDRRRCQDLLGAAYTLLGTWVITRLSHHFHVYPTRQFFPFMDFWGMAVMAVAWRHRFRPWKVAMIALFLFQCIWHAIRVKNPIGLYLSDLILNLSFACQLACIWPTVIGVRQEVLRRRLKPM